MTTTNLPNASKMQPPDMTANPSTRNPQDLVVTYFRQTADGVNFTITPVYLPLADAMAAQNTSPQEWSMSENFAPWTRPPNAAQKPGGLGRLRGTSVAAD